MPPRWMEAVRKALEEKPAMVFNVTDPDGKGDFSVVLQGLDRTDKTCRAKGTTDGDDGRKLEKGAKIRACYDYTDKILYTSSKAPQLLKHELCHRANPPEWDAKKKKWIYKKDCRNIPGAIWD